MFRCVAFSSLGTLPDAPKVIVKLMGLGWVERMGTGPEVSFRITDAGTEALKKPIPLR